MFVIKTFTGAVLSIILFSMVVSSHSPTLVHELLYGEEGEALTRVYSMEGEEASLLASSLINLMDQVGPKEQESILVSLAHLGPYAREAIPRLLILAEDVDSQIGLWAIWTLATIGEPAINDLLQLKSRLLHVVPALVAALESEFMKVRWSSVWALGQIGHEAREAIPALVCILKRTGTWDKTIWTREELWLAYETFKSLAQIGPEAIPLVVDIHTKEPDMHGSLSIPVMPVVHF